MLFTVDMIESAALAGETWDEYTGAIQWELRSRARERRMWLLLHDRADEATDALPNWWARKVSAKLRKIRGGK